MLKKTDLHNFADDNTITAVCHELADLVKILETEGELSVGWFRENEMVVNSGKFQAIIVNRKEEQAAHKLIIDNKEIKTTNSIKLLGINIDDQVRFNELISILCSKAAMQLNALSRLQKYMGKSEKETIINSFILSNFNYCPLVWHFSSCESIRKIEKIQKRCLRIILNDYKAIMIAFNSIKLLGINIDDQVRFNERISILCSKAAMQLNALSRLQK